jgi:hypothetical protein
MATNITILKCSQYSCLRICNIDDTKVDINWISTRLELLLQLETNEHSTKTEKQIHRTKTVEPNTKQFGWIFLAKIDLKSLFFNRLK